MGANMLYVVIFSVGEIRALVAGEKLAGKMVPQVLFPVVLAHCRVGADGALKYPLIIPFILVVSEVGHVVVIAVGVVATALAPDHPLGA